MSQPNWALEVEGQTLLAAHRFDEAIAKVQPLLTREDDVFADVAPLYVANAMANAGRLDGAEAVLSAAAANDTRRGTPSLHAERQVAIAYLLWLKHDAPGAIAAVEPFLPDFDNPDPLSLAGAVLARSGAIPAAQHTIALLDRWPDVPVVSRARMRLRAEVALATHAPSFARFLSSIDPRFPSPLLLEFNLHVAVVARQDVNTAGHQIESRPDVLLGWSDWWTPPGMSWLGFCAANPSGRRSGQTCR
jgi:hypothetical protein